MPEWTAFAGFVGVVLVGLLFLARASADVLAPAEPPLPEPTAVEYPASLGDRVVGTHRSGPPPFSTTTLLVNVVVSQGLFGFGDATALREAMAPDSAAGWAVLLLVVLPLVAGFEELLFRGVLIGAFATGFDVSPWLLAALSSVAFALGHGAQGRVGIVVTGALGFVLAAAFVLTGSLVAVVVAHYLVNALEFVVSERWGS